MWVWVWVYVFCGGVGGLWWTIVDDGPVSQLLTKQTHNTVGDTTANAITPAVAVLDEGGLVRLGVCMYVCWWAADESPK